MTFKNSERIYLNKEIFLSFTDFFWEEYFSENMWSLRV